MGKTRSEKEEISGKYQIIRKKILKLSFACMSAGFVLFLGSNIVETNHRHKTQNLYKEQAKEAIARYNSAHSDLEILEQLLEATSKIPSIKSDEVRSYVEPMFLRSGPAIILREAIEKAKANFKEKAEDQDFKEYSEWKYRSPIIFNALQFIGVGTAIAGGVCGIYLLHRTNKKEDKELASLLN